MTLSLHNASASIFVPDGVESDEALKRCTHLGVGAHQDDLEFMAFHGIVECFHSVEKWFAGVTCTDGAGSARGADYAGVDSRGMCEIRRREQEIAAAVGRYGAVVQLGYSSETAKGPGKDKLIADLEEILRLVAPEIVYTHNPADKHETHVAVFAAVIAAIRRLPASNRPRTLLGCEGWRGLDWMLDSDKTLLDVSRHENLAAALNGLFDSQISSGKRYDLAVKGRRKANATFLNSHQGDQCQDVCLAMDLSPLLRDDALDVTKFTIGFVDRMRADVIARLARQVS
jgi:LmbE family N-acetylglucosaminyl deacetylase